MSTVTESRFVTDLIANSNELPIILTAPLIYRSVVLNAEMTIPAGFPTDLASIPRLVQLLIPKYGKHNRAAVGHDWLYQKGRIASIGDGRPVTRKEADLMLYEGMRCSGVRRTRAWAIYQGVRFGGWVSWRKYRKGYLLWKTRTN